jgi:hypothetical protein
LRTWKQSEYGKQVPGSVIASNMNRPVAAWYRARTYKVRNADPHGLQTSVFERLPGAEGVAYYAVHARNAPVQVASKFAIVNLPSLAIQEASVACAASFLTSRGKD